MKIERIKHNINKWLIAHERKVVLFIFIMVIAFMALACECVGE